MTQAKPTGNRILYFTNKGGISQSYRPAFQSVLLQAGVKVSSVLPVNIYSAVPSPLKKKANSKSWTLDPEKKHEVLAQIDKHIAVVKPRLLVISCPAVLGAIAGNSSVDLCRGSVYEYRGLTCIVTFPIDAIHKRADTKNRDEDGFQSYTVKAGRWVLINDWQKVQRHYTGAVRHQPEFTYTVIRTVAAGKIAVEWLSDCAAISNDIETKGGAHQAITCIGYTGIKPDGRVHTFVFPFYDAFKVGGCFWESSLDHQIVWLQCKAINANKAIKIFQNGSYDNSWYIRDRIPTYNYHIDTIHLWHSLYPELPKRLDYIASFCLDRVQFWKEDIKGIDAKDVSKQDSDMETYFRYNALDCYNTLMSCRVLLAILLSSDWAKWNYMTEFQMMLIALKMSMRGFKADKMLLGEIRCKLEAEALQAEKDFRTLADDPELNVNSPVQIKEFLYEQIGMPKIGPRAKRGTTDKKVLKLVRLEHPLYAYIIDTLAKAKEPKRTISNICDMTMYTKRFRTALSACGTETWRFASKASNFWDGTNMQNIPESYRNWLCADPGYILVDADYSQSDGYFVAFESEDPVMIDTFTSGKDTHAIHAAFFFKTTYEKVIEGVKKKDKFFTHPQTGIRPITKRVVHGANFLMRETTLYYTMGKESVVAAALAMGFKDAGRWQESNLIGFCKKLLSGYRDMYIRLNQQQWYGEIKQLLVSSAMITNAFGMTRIFFGDANDDDTQREATAFYGQSDTAGNINRSLMELNHGYIPSRFRDAPNPSYKTVEPFILEDHGGQLLLQNHDSIVFQVPIENHIELINNTLTVMERPVIIHGRTFSVPADCKVGLRWGKTMIPWNRDNPPTLDQIKETIHVKL